MCIRDRLKEESTALNEVVVVGYGTMKRKEMTSAISHVGAKDLNQISSLDASMPVSYTHLHHLLGSSRARRVVEVVIDSTASCFQKLFQSRWWIS